MPQSFALQYLNFSRNPPRIAIILNIVQQEIPSSALPHNRLIWISDIKIQFALDQN